MLAGPMELAFRSKADGSAVLISNSLAEMEARALRDTAYRREVLAFLASVQRALAEIQRRVEGPPPSTADLDARDHARNSAKGRTATERLRTKTPPRPRLVWKTDEEDPA